ncbi:unnamed protein product [Eruca vesicaria subsp. sativa]|uniref:PB1 domain-containing protein n=1 Tax=Eruca vesicaria subsp. sativa TaxID=29727 RepID=A0ABC8K4W7_ERUVS|nr:unnamed protein product [Eruca vesicaria subsp. sativa]
MVAVDINKKNSGNTLKFLCSYGGKILPRSTDGKLRYVGGHTRVLSVHRSISFEELTKKLIEFCGYSVDLRCQLPNGDLETLITVKSDEELANIVEEYDRVTGAKIRAVLSPPRGNNRQESPSSSSSDRSPKSPLFSVTPSPPNSPSSAYGRYLQSRYCLHPTEIGRRYIHGYGESYCYANRGNKELIRH